MSIRLRLTLLFVAALALLAALGSVATYLVVSDNLHARGRDTAAALARAAAATPDVEELSLERLGGRGDVIWVVDASGTVVAKTSNATGTTLAQVRAEVARRVSAGMTTASAARRDGGQAVVLQDDRATRTTLRTLRWVLLLAGLGGLLVAAGLGSLLAARALRPVDHMRDEVDRIPGHELDRRIAEGRPDELGRLARAFNRLLERADAAAREQERFIADASHELKTPVTAVEGHARLIARALDRHDDALARESTEVVVRESRRIAVTLRELLALSEVGATTPAGGVARLDRAVAEAVDEARALDPARSVQLLTAPATVRGDEGRLRELVLVLVDNALRYSGPDGPVEVALDADTAGAVVRVRDHGPGMTDDDIAHAFDRFHRGSASAGVPGSGLGLAIAGTIALSHGARITFTRPGEGGGTLVEVRFPPAPG